MNIGSKLRYLIEEANITQRQLADALHISPSALNGYINQGKEPDYATLVRIADYFHTSTDYLLGRSDDVGTSVAAHKLQKHLDGLNSYDLDIAEKFIEVLASKSSKPPSDKA